MSQAHQWSVWADDLGNKLHILWNHQISLKNTGQHVILSPCNPSDRKKYTDLYQKKRCGWKDIGLFTTCIAGQWSEWSTKKIKPMRTTISTIFIVSLDFWHNSISNPRRQQGGTDNQMRYCQQSHTTWGEKLMEMTMLEGT